jgi:N-acyl-D-aspartate/D-glutamate deacylase
MHDLVIRGGTVVDGTGSKPRRADVAVEGDRIVAVGSEVGAGRREIDATGQLVLPGWVDIHTHYDGQVTWDTHLTPSGWNGVTTVVMGNCGVGFAPVRPGKQEFLIQLMEGVEDIPGTALAEGISWEWETFGEYLDAVERMPRAIDVGAQVPHGAEEMARVVREALQAGALGFSTSRTILHRAKDGELVPGTRAGEDEVLGIGRVLGEVGHGVFQVASDLTPEGDELHWMKQLSRETGRRVSFACLQNGLDPEQWRRLLVACEEDAREGGGLTPQVAQRPAGLLLGFESTIHPFIFYSEYQKLASLPIAERRQQLAEPAVRERILGSPPDDSAYEGVIAIVAKGYDNMYPLGDPPDYEPGPEKSVAAIAKREGRHPREVLYDVMLEREGQGIVYLPLLGYSHGNLDAMREMMLHPQAVFGLSDGGAHCGLICDASMPTFLLTHWARDRSRGERIPIEALVEAQTRRTAECYGMEDRGVLAPGMKADLNVIDFDALHIHAPEMVHDLPAEGRRLIQKVDGYRYTICSGEVIYEDGKPTGRLPGKLIRGPQPAPAA